jgi:hypothetical protein
MLTDDQLTRELADVFHATTHGLAYDGRVPKGPRTPMYVAPAVAVVGAAALAVVATSGGDRPGQMQVHSGLQPYVAGPQHTAHPHLKLVTRKIRLAGFTMSYTEPSVDHPMVATVITSVPASAESVQGDDATTQYWIGVDPSTGWETGYVVTADGFKMSIGSADATRDELLAMFQGAEPQMVPLVGASNN